MSPATRSPLLLVTVVATLAMLGSACGSGTGGGSGSGCTPASGTATTLAGGATPATTATSTAAPTTSATPATAPTAATAPADGARTDVSIPPVDYASLSGTLNGSGATFPKPFYDEAIADFADVASDVTVNYGGGGSGKGKTDLAEQVVQWAGSDSAVKDEDVAKFKGGAFLYFPTVAAPITLSYNLAAVPQLQLSPSTLAQVMQCQVTKWNDPAVAADNPGVNLPDTRIVVVHRSDGSGTTSNFTKYLATAAPGSWMLGSGDTVNWPTGTQAGNGNAGVAQIVKSTVGAIGYVDLSDALGANLVFASIRNRDGQFVAPTVRGATAALEAARVKDDLTYSALDATGAEAYPITAGTYVIVYERQPDAKLGEALRGWITYLLTDAQALAPDVDFAPLPESMADRALAQISKMEIG